MEEVFPSQHFEKEEAKLKQQGSSKELPAVYNKREALDRDYKLYLTNRGHQELIDLYYEANGFAYQIEHSRGADFKKMQQHNYNTTLHKIYDYEKENELFSVRDTYMMGGI